MASATSKTTLLTLPRELRDLIYDCVFTPRDSADTIEIDTIAIQNSKPTKARSRAPGILLACKQIRAESLVPYVRCSSFKCDYTATTRVWLEQMPLKYHRNIQELRIITLGPLSEPLHYCTAAVDYLVNRKNMCSREGKVQIGDGVLKAVYRGPDNELFAFGSEEELAQKKTW